MAVGRVKQEPRRRSRQKSCILNYLIHLTNANTHDMLDLDFFLLEAQGGGGGGNESGKGQLSNNHLLAISMSMM